MVAFEKSYLRKALKRNDWNRKRTAEELRIGYSTLKTKMRAYGLGHDDEED